MAHSHAHSHRAPRDGDVEIGGRVRVVLLGFLALAALLTVVGVIALWPGHGPVDRARAEAPYAAPGVTTPNAEVLSVGPACPAGGSRTKAPKGCDMVEVKILDGAGKGQQASVRVPTEVTTSGIGRGDHLELLRQPAQDGQPVTYAYSTVRRAMPLLWLALVFVVIVLLVAGRRGAMAVVGLVISAATLYWFLFPALLSGKPGLAVACVSASAIMFVVLYSTHGVSLRTSTALAGTLVGIGLTALVGTVVIGSAHLTGIADETGGTLSTFAGSSLSFQGLLACSMVLAGLGVLNDVTITQASSVWELRAAAPGSSRREVFTGAMRIGRDHIASTIYTIVFAYAGSALVLLMLLYIYDRPILDLASTESLAEEVARTFTSAIGLVLAVPVTTAIAALIAGPRAVADHPDDSDLTRR
ncbi:MAG TPA: YibE/F family protein [Nocardioides sp.]|uniref:YibE/F family protein n=1 Tax=Nocardioides sp. TaxID=35761 RepID=UPI002E2EECBE|nr:YibE/F family protein [Nocardioides sp.]HEX3929530.1 YibE/F family protein [Nocardioides sp.]